MREMRVSRADVDHWIEMHDAEAKRRVQAEKERDEARAAAQSALDDLCAAQIRQAEVERLRRLDWDIIPQLGQARRERDEAVSLLRAIWHGEGPDKWPDPIDFRRRVEALVGEPPPSKWQNVAEDGWCELRGVGVYGDP